MKWFALDEDEKMAQGGAYGHVDRKFTGYRAGKFREQLEVRQTIDDAHRGGLYPWPTAPDAFGAELRRLIYFLDATARKLLRHIAVDVGRDGFFEGLLDLPPPPLSEIDASSAGAAAATGDGEGAPPSLGTPIRLCRYAPTARVLRLQRAARGAQRRRLHHARRVRVDRGPRGAAPRRRPLGARRGGAAAEQRRARAPRDGRRHAWTAHGQLLRAVQAPRRAAARGLRADRPAVPLPRPLRRRPEYAADARGVRQGGARRRLAEMETTTIKELPAFDSAKSILRGWFRSVKSD